MLLLGGTGEARALARALVGAGVPVTSSLAGRVRDPALPDGDVRIGGYGGPDGLAAFLREHRPRAVVDATHPFAASISGNAAAACSATGTALLLLRRPGWQSRPGDDWQRVPSVAAAASAALRSTGTVFVTTGRRDLAAYAGDDTHHYVIRTVDPPDVALPPRHTLLLDRGPYDFARERAIFAEHDVRLLVTKDSGGSLTVAKLDVARALHVPVVVVDRPPVPSGVPVVADVDAALSWLRALPRRDSGAG